MKLQSRISPFSLDLCLESGQSFAWRKTDQGWIGTMGRTAYRLEAISNGVKWKASGHVEGAERQLSHYLALEEEHSDIVEKFPQDPFLLEAVRFCGGLRVLRQDPWECLAGFILSSTKQIVHIQQIWRKVSTRWGEPMEIGETDSPLTVHAFPSASVLARCTEKQLRDCAMGFRAPYLLAAARAVDTGNLNLESLHLLSTEEAREKLMALKGVGRKIADCVLLFSLGKSEAFPVDTWILKVLRRIYFPGRRKAAPKKLLEFAVTHFGPWGGHAQQYLFHYARMNPHFAPEKKSRRK